ncbi:MAG: L-threonylcarbamoyladenylate synthase [Aigarchaeota archaeon]|nr:L-threonylcarbamoyladenylate synthase [Aigarchaeota archaeon]MDW8092469.1 L-threonylcarbamoyladenylate synthase [Nitrososphaerota archaeon]
MTRVLLGHERSSISTAASLIRANGTIIYPTDTVYGLGCNPFSETAVRRVFELKRREAKPMPVLCADIDQVSAVAYLTEDAMKLAALFWPGPLSIVLRKREGLPPLLTSHRDEVAVRIPANVVALELMRTSGSPIVGTSANISGEEAATKIDELPNELLMNVDLVVDGGPTLYKKSSTVVRMVGGEIVVLREGAVSVEQLISRIEEARLDLSVRRYG